MQTKDLQGLLTTNSAESSYELAKLTFETPEMGEILLLEFRDGQQERKDTYSVSRLMSERVRASETTTDTGRVSEFLSPSYYTTNRKSPRELRHVKVSIDSKKPIRNSQQVLIQLHSLSPGNASKVIPWCLPEDGSGDEEQEETESTAIKLYTVSFPFR
ncbi:hypothetical protein APICC_02563 [Apis cerana cerana]|uniref:Uncharacterized protein n=1 Tax=Apis cerana cerana TaxID=94128 RepID=A0A2A3EHU0_APICC|nr:hypothetical protein APICC_02563 [Apis cerana cerana]